MHAYFRIGACCAVFALAACTKSSRGKEQPTRSEPEVKAAMPETTKPSRQFSVFTPEEEAAMREHGIAVYRDRLILEARPPITAKEVAAIEERIGTKVPDGLLELWKVSYGGRLDYDLTVPLGEHVFSASFNEIFWPGSDGYRDLIGWIEHEKEGIADAAEANGEQPPKVLEALPFGGFEYLERLYILTQGPDRGRVLIYAEGLPPAWKGRLTESTVAPVAPSIADLFDMLELTKDPRKAKPDDYASGVDMLEAIDALGKKHPELAKRLDGLVAESVFDWRGLVARTKFSGQPRQVQAGRLALVAAADANDVELLETLVRHRYPLDAHVVGKSTALSYAVSKGATGVVNGLLDSGRPLGETTIVYAKDLDVALVDRLIEEGTRFDVESVLSAAQSGSVDAAARIVEKGERNEDWGDLRAVIAKRQALERSHAQKIEDGTMASYATPAQHRKQADRLDELVRRL